jgi:ComF family protein
MVNNWINIIQDCLIPPTCILCEGAGFDSQDICHACFNDLQRNTDCCYRCAQLFEMPSITPHLCEDCLDTPPIFDEAHAPFIHQGITRYLITSLKFNKQYKNARLLGYLLADYLDQSVEKPALIIPIPLHKQRYKERGFNQSIEIAKNLSKRLAIPLDTTSCIRQRDTLHQVGLSGEERRQNIKNAFMVRKTIKAHHVAIVDDVVTTGATANEFAIVLKKSGVSRVDLWSCSRA